MVRIKRGAASLKKRKKVLKQTKGFRWGRKSKYKQAKEALMHSRTYAYRDRKTKKRVFRRSWQSRINSACRKEGLSYSNFINQLKKNSIELDRKILSQLVDSYPEIFKKTVEQAKEAK